MTIPLFDSAFGPVPPDLCEKHGLPLLVKGVCSECDAEQADYQAQMEVDRFMQEGY